MRARRDIDTALELSPRDPEAHVLLGAWHFFRNEIGPAEARFRRALALGPRNPSCVFALASFYFSLEERKPAALREYDRVRHLIERLEPISANAEHSNFVGWYWAVRNEPERGLPFAKQAVEEDASCAACYDTLALLLSENGEFAQAVEAQHIALNLSEGDYGGMRTRLKAFEQKLG